jgi:uncharacterized membrane protein YphA (DoxX/SURF4 family)
MRSEVAVAPADPSRTVSFGALLARWLLAALFLYMGANKALNPVEFLKLVRQYDILHTPFLLNFVASTLPWFEIFCGLLLLLGVAVRGTAVMLVGMLVPFTAVILTRALEIHGAGNIAFCAIKFDCGCGSGAVLICRKLAENTLLIALSVWLVLWRYHRPGLWPAVFGLKNS